MSSVDDLKRRFAIPGLVQIDAGQGSLPRVVVTSDLAQAEIYLHGAHITQFQPRGAKPVLFMSQESQFLPSKPIRGGVPLVFPWFGGRAQPPDSPAHGFARIREWSLETCERQADGSVRLLFTLSSDASTLGLWPHPFSLRMTFSIGTSLELTLEARGPGRGAPPLTFEEAFHTYLRVGDVREITLEGLESAGYIDKVDAGRRKSPASEPIRISGETDRVYEKTQSTCIVRDPVFERTLRVEKENSGSTVVWNPWIGKARAMPDFGDEEWPEMVCIETANVGEGAIHLEGEQTHSMRALIKLAP
jgi:D-hexose-6-phosphate mutarotase